MVARRGAKKNPAAAVLRQLSRMISELTQEDLEAIASGEARLTLVYASDRESTSSEADKVTVDLQHLQQELSSADTVEAGFAVLYRVRPTRTELGKLARSLEIPVAQRDTIPRLEEKIVEALVGSRLNSRAVRGQ